MMTGYCISMLRKKEYIINISILTFVLQVHGTNAYYGRVVIINNRVINDDAYIRRFTRDNE